LEQFRQAIGEAGVQALLKATIETAVTTQAVRQNEFERVIVDSTVQEKALAHPVDSRLPHFHLRKTVGGMHLFTTSESPAFYPRIRQASQLNGRIDAEPVIPLRSKPSPYQGHSP